MKKLLVIIFLWGLVNVCVYGGGASSRPLVDATETAEEERAAEAAAEEEVEEVTRLLLEDWEDEEGEEEGEERDIYFGLFILLMYIMAGDGGEGCG